MPTSSEKRDACQRQHVKGTGYVRFIIFNLFYFNPGFVFASYIFISYFISFPLSFCIFFSWFHFSEREKHRIKKLRGLGRERRKEERRRKMGGGGEEKDIEKQEKRK